MSLRQDTTHTSISEMVTIGFVHCVDNTSPRYDYQITNTHTLTHTRTDVSELRQDTGIQLTRHRERLKI
jgi:hypothetical protein